MNVTRAILVMLVAACAKPVAAPLTYDPLDSYPTAEHVLQQMYRTYAHARSYADIGLVSSTSANRSFRTDFVRPQLRFDVTDDGLPETYRLWSDGKAAVTRNADKLEMTSIESALRDAKDASYSASRWIPTLLTGVDGRVPLTRLELVGNKRFAGHDCWEIIGYDDIGGGYRLDVDKHSHLLVWVLHASTHGFGDELETTEIIRYEPVVDDAEVEVEPIAHDDAQLQSEGGESSTRLDDARAATPLATP